MISNTENYNIYFSWWKRYSNSFCGKSI